MITSRWQDVADSQSGVLTRQQALAGGLSAEAWRWRLQAGRWTSLLPGVVVLHNGPPTEEQVLWAAVLGAGPRAALTGDAALRAWGMRLEAPQVLHLATPGDVRRAPHRLRLGEHPGLHVVPHRVTRFDRVVHPARRPALLRPAAALLHAAAWAPSDRAASWRLAAAVQQRVVQPEQVRAMSDVLTRLPRRGLTDSVMKDVELGAHAATELDLLRLCRAFRLPRPDQLQLRLRTATRLHYLDAWWERQRVLLEADGALHRDATTWGADRLRTNDVAIATRGRDVVQLRATNDHLRHLDRQLVDQMRAVLL